MKKIYYCIVEKIEVPDEMTDDEIDRLICEKAFDKKTDTPKDYMWSDKDNLLEYN